MGVKGIMKGQGWGLTFTTRISLHELFLRASLGKLRRKTCQLRKDFVDKANFRSKIVLVKMQG